MKNEIEVFDIETNQHFALGLDGDQVVSFKRNMDNVGTEETEAQKTAH